MSAVLAHSVQPATKFILNHDIMSATADGVLGNHLYSARALGISGPRDIIQLHPDLQPLWPAIRDHYQRIGLSHSDNVIWDLGLQELGAHIGYQPSVFYFGPRECAHWGDHQWLETVEYINSKNNFMALAARLGVDVPRTLCFDSVKDIDSNAIGAMAFPCYLKAAVSVSGVGIYRCVDEAALRDAMRQFADDVPLQLQEEVVTDTFLNLQYLVADNTAVRLAASEQLLDGPAHQGNRVPVSQEPWTAVDVMADWLVEHGMKGIFAFDVAVVESDLGIRYPVIECNPRYNGASYPTLIAQKLDIPEWSAVYMKTRHRTLAGIDLSEIEFDHNTGEGAIIVNWGTVLVGKPMILLAGSRDYQAALTVELDARLC